MREFSPSYFSPDIEAAPARYWLLSTIGASSVVHSAASFVTAVRGRARTVLLDAARCGPATAVLPFFVTGLPGA